MSIVARMSLLKNRRTKIVATLGPASNDEGSIRRLIEAGANVFRLNMSHGSHDTHRALYRAVRKAAADVGQHVGVLADLCGPKIRTGHFREGQIELATGSRVTVTTRDIVGEPGLIPSQYKALSRDVSSGDRILLDDGNLELRVEQVDGSEVACTVVYGGLLKDNKGINLPGVNISAPSLTDKDRSDAMFAMDLGIDFLALSFVRRAADVEDLKQLVREAGHDTQVIAKIEKPEALASTTAILTAADAVMVARGDLGVELRPEEVPTVQRELIERARALNRPVIVATQMLESMITHARPTRAEVTDISHAVDAGADAVMLSAETASGAYPVQSVEIMSRIAHQTEAYLWGHGSFGSLQRRSSRDQKAPIGDAVANAAAQLSHDVAARAVLVLSRTGMSAVTVSAARPAAPVVAISALPRTCQRMSLLWGVIPLLAEEAGLINPNHLARRVARTLGLGDEGDTVLVVRGFHSDAELNTPSVTALTL